MPKYENRKMHRTQIHLPAEKFKKTQEILKTMPGKSPAATRKRFNHWVEERMDELIARFWHSKG